MKALYIQAFIHVPYEGLGCIGKWILERKHAVDYTLFYEANPRLPELDDIDCLIIMGGPMSVHDEELYPWLKEEKAFVRKAIDAGKTVLGICLGAQIIAEALGAKVFRAKQKEIGWFNINLTPEAQNIAPFDSFGKRLKVFHFHGETFDLPEGSQHLYYSDICPNQAFSYKERVIGLQFHFEVTWNSAQIMLENNKQEFVNSKSDSIQSIKDILAEKDNVTTNNERMFELLDYLSQNNY